MSSKRNTHREFDFAGGVKGGSKQSGRIGRRPLTLDPTGIAGHGAVATVTPLPVQPLDCL